MEFTKFDIVAQMAGLASNYANLSRHHSTICLGKFWQLLATDPIPRWHFFLCLTLLLN
jgi:hypothetical protein